MREPEGSLFYRVTSPVIWVIIVKFWDGEDFTDMFFLDIESG